MSPEKRRLIQSMGGKASTTKFKANDERTKELGSKGGKKSKRKPVDKNGQ